MALTQQGGGRQLRIPGAPAPPRPRQRLSGERGCLGARLGAGASRCLQGPPEGPSAAPRFGVGTVAAARRTGSFVVVSHVLGVYWTWLFLPFGQWGEVPPAPSSSPGAPPPHAVVETWPFPVPQRALPILGTPGLCPSALPRDAAGKASCLEPSQRFALVMAGSGTCRVRNPLPGTWLHPQDLLVGLSGPGGSWLHRGAGGLVARAPPREVQGTQRRASPTAHAGTANSHSLPQNRPLPQQLGAPGPGPAPCCADGPAGSGVRS